MRPRLVVLLAIAAAVLVLALPSAAAGHAELDAATPGAGDEVVGSPTELVLTFTQDLDMARTALEVHDASGATVAEGPELAGPRELRLALPDLAPGVYEVRWTSFSAEDSELARGRYSFTVLQAASPSPASSVAATSAPSTGATPAATAAPTPVASVAPSTPDGGAVALLPIGIAAVALLAIGAWLLRRR